MTRPSNDLLFLPLLLFLLLLLISNSPTVNSFRFFKSLWRSGNSSTTTTTTSTTISPPPPVPEKFISSSTSPQPEPPATSTVSSIPHLAFYLARYPHLNESYLAELVTASPNVTAHVERFSASDHHPHHHPHHHHNETDHLPFLEEEEEELFHHGNVTLHLQPAPPSTPLLNISTYFEIGGSSSAQSKPPSPLSPLTSDQNQDDEKPFSVLITNDKTMAYLRFDLSGRQLDACTLYDIEKEPEAALKVPLQTGLQPLTADYKTLLEAVRRCTEMSRKQLQATPGNVLATSTTTTASTTTTSTSTSTTPSPLLGGNETSVTDVPPITSNTTVSASLIGKPPSNNSSINLGGSSFLPSSNSSASSSGGPGANFISMWKGIVPGTKWCGLGDSALDYHDLGGKADVDLCCRAHDHCPVRLKAFRMGYGLINFSFYTKSHCDCDQDFLRCLQLSTTSYSAMLRNFYFNVLKVQCLKADLAPPVCVKKRKAPTNSRKEECLQYEVSKTTKMKIVPFEYP